MSNILFLRKEDKGYILYNSVYVTLRKKYIDTEKNSVVSRT